MPTHHHYYKEHIMYVTKKRYTMFNFAVDIGLTCLTGGLWLIWVFVREMRGR